MITAKNYKPSERLQDNIEKKFTKLEKFFDEDVTANVIVSKFKDKTKLEATINTKQNLFRAEEISDNVYEAMDLVIDRLSSQMKKFKGKLESRYKENKALKFEFIPDDDEEEDNLTVVKRKQFELQPMNYEEAILQMNLLGHEFFMFSDAETGDTCVVYTRRDGDYGLIRPQK